MMSRVTNFHLEEKTRDRVWMAILRCDGVTFTPVDIREQMRRDASFRGEPPTEEYIRSVLRLGENRGALEHVPGSDRWRVARGLFT